MQINVRRDSATPPRKEQKPKKERTVIKKSSGRSQESRDEKRARRLAEMQAERSSLTEEMQAEVSMDDPFAELKPEEITEHFEEPVSEQAPEEEWPLLEESTDGLPESEEQVEELPGVELTEQYAVEYEEAVQESQPPTATMEDVQAVFPAPAPEMHGDTAEVLKDAEGQHRKKSGLDLGPAKSRREQRKASSGLEDSGESESSEFRKKSKHQVTSKKSKGINDPKPKKRSRETVTASDGDSLDLAYSGVSVKGGDSLTFLFLIGMLIAAGVFAGAGYFLSDFVGNLILPIGV